MAITHTMIAERAYFLWARSGKREGYDLANWFAAESQVTLESRAPHLKSREYGMVGRYDPAAEVRGKVR
jgi:hypothetical protein